MTDPTLDLDALGKALEAGVEFAEAWLQDARLSDGERRKAIAEIDQIKAARRTALPQALATIRVLQVENARLKGIEELWNAGKEKWEPVYKVVLDERDAALARVAELEAENERLRQREQILESCSEDDGEKIEELRDSAARLQRRIDVACATLAGRRADAEGK